MTLPTRSTRLPSGLAVLGLGLLLALGAVAHDGQEHPMPGDSTEGLPAAKPRPPAAAPSAAEAKPDAGAKPAAKPDAEEATRPDAEGEAASVSPVLPAAGLMKATTGANKPNNRRDARTPAPTRTSRPHAPTQESSPPSESVRSRRPGRSVNTTGPSTPD